jgi:hypothetical protein
MRRSCFLPLCLLLPAIAAGAACTVDANVGALPAHSGDGGSDANRPESSAGDALPADDAPSPDAATTDADAGADAFDAAVDFGCGITMAQEGAWIDVQVVQDVIPPGSGGRITPGTYALTAFRSFLSGPQGTAQIRETLVVTGSPTVGAFASAYEIRNTTGDFISHAPQGVASTYQADPATTAIFLDEQCPEPGMTGGNFSVTPNGFTLLGGDRPIERVYTKIR